MSEESSLEDNLKAITLSESDQLNEMSLEDIRKEALLTVKRGTLLCKHLASAPKKLVDDALLDLRDSFLLQRLVLLEKVRKVKWLIFKYDKFHETTAQLVTPLENDSLASCGNERLLLLNYIVRCKKLLDDSSISSLMTPLERKLTLSVMESAKASVERRNDWDIQQSLQYARGHFLYWDDLERYHFKTMGSRVHWIVSQNMIDAEEMLTSYLVSGVDINEKDNNGETPLHNAVRSCNVECIKFLLSKGCKVNAQDINGITPIYLAVEIEEADLAAEITQLLIDYNAIVSWESKLGETPLHFAASNPSGHAAMKLLMRFRSDDTDLNKPDSDNRSPLHWAASASNRQGCMLLVGAGANVLLRNDYGELAVDEAIQAYRSLEVKHGRRYKQAKATVAYLEETTGWSLVSHCVITPSIFPDCAVGNRSNSHMDDFKITLRDTTTGKSLLASTIKEPLLIVPKISSTPLSNDGLPSDDLFHIDKNAFFVTCIAHGDGIFSYIYKVRYPGFYKIELSLYGCQIPGSPFTFKASLPEESATAALDQSLQEAIDRSRRLRSKKF